MASAEISVARVSHREHRAFQQRAQRRVVGRLGVVDAGEDLRQLHLRILFADLGELHLHAVIDADVRVTLGLDHPKGGRRAAVEARDRAHLADAVAHLRQIREAREAPPGQGDLASAEGGRGARAAEHADGLLAAAELRAAAGRVQVQRAQLLVDLDGGDAERLHARRVELDADLAVDPAAALHLRDAGHLQQPLGDGVVDEPGQLLLRERARADRVEDHRAAVGIDALDRGFLDALGQQHPHLGDRIAHVGDRAVDRGADLELYEYVRLAFDRPGSDVVDVADAGDRAFDLLHHLRFQLLRRRAGLADADEHARKGDIGVGGHGQAYEAHDAHEQQHHEQYDRGQGVADRPR